MKKKFVQATNVIQIADTLLQLDRSHLQEKYHLDAISFIHELQQSLEQYTLPPVEEKEIKQWNAIDNIEYALKNLIISVNAFIRLLNPEIKQQIEQQFTMQL